MLTISGHVNEVGIIKVDNTTELQAWQDMNKNRRVVITIKAQRAKRSNPQNNYYFGVVIPAVKEGINILGHEVTEEDVHELLKAKYNFREIEVIPDHFIEVPQSTTKMDTVAFMDYLDKIKMFASQMLGIYIPDPSESMAIDNISKQ